MSSPLTQLLQYCQAGSNNQPTPTDWINAFTLYNNQYESVFDITQDDSNATEQNILLIVKYIHKQYDSSKSIFIKSTELHILSIQFMKIISRIQYKIDLLFTKDFIAHLNNNSTDEIDVSLTPAEITLRENLSLESNKLLLNLFIKNAAAITSIYEHNSKMFSNFIKCLVKHTTSTEADKSASASDSLYIYTRLLFHMTLSTQLCDTVSKQCNIYYILVDVFIQHTSPLPDESEPGWPTFSGSEQAAIDNRRLVDQLCKVYVNLLVNGTDTNKFKTSFANVSDELKKHFVEHVVTVLAYDVQMDKQVEDLIDGTLQVRNHKSSNVSTQLDEISLNSGEIDYTKPQNDTTVSGENTSNAISEAPQPVRDQTTSSNTSTQPQQSSQPPLTETAVNTHNAKSWSSPELQKIQNPFTRHLFERMQIDESEGTNYNPSLRMVKISLCYVLLYTAEQLSTMLFTVTNRQSLLSIQSIVNLLHQHLIWCQFHPNEVPTRVLPLTSTLTAICKYSTVARKHVKLNVFKQYAYDETNSNTTSNVQQQQQQMIPAGAVNERDVDSDPYSLRSLLTKYITSLDSNVKTVISEFLWVLCNENSAEYTRLVGFGRAVGLLQAKGLFKAQNTQTVHNPDQILAQGKKL